MKHLLLFFALLFAGWQLQAQTEKEKQLLLLEQEVSDKNVNDSELCNDYAILMWDYRTRDIEKTLLYFNKAIAFARELNNVEWESMYWKRMGAIYGEWRKSDTALIFFDHALKLIEGKNFYNEEASNYELRGTFFSELNDHEKAMNSYMKAMELNDKDRTKNIADKNDISKNIKTDASLLMNIAGIYYALYNLEKSIAYMLKAKQIIEDNRNIDFSRFEYKLLGNLAQAYIGNRQSELALPLLLKSYELADAKEDLRNKVFSLQRLSNFYRIEQKNYKQALSYAKEALQIAE
jgi:tetratricopeptide (TPR) repeat protein